MGEASWHQRWQKKEREEPCFLLLFSAPVKMVCLGSFFFLFLLFYLLLLHTPARLLCNTTETPSGIEKCCNVSESVCVCVSVWSRTDPTIPKTHFLCLFHFRTLSHTRTHKPYLSAVDNFSFFFFSFFWAVRQNAKLPPPSLHTRTHTHTSNSGPFLHLQARFSLLTL